MQAEHTAPVITTAAPHVIPTITPPPSDTKPRLRGWSHAVFAVVMGLAGLALVVVTPTVPGRLGAAVYLLAGVVMFSMSAVYHRGHWSTHTRLMLRRADHANIFCFIAGTYTPLATQLLAGTQRVVLLVLVWGLALAGIAFKLVWLQAPRWLYVLLYIAMGWVAIAWMPQLWHVGGPDVVVLLVTGGLVYTAGAVVYARKRPNPSPIWFGFHEIFHACTIVAAVCHYVAICLATF